MNMIYYYLFNILGDFSHGKNSPLIPTRVRDKMVGSTSSVKRVPADFLTTIFPNIGREPTREALIGVHMLISGNAASVAYDFRRYRHRHLVLTITAKDYTL